MNQDRQHISVLSLLHYVQGGLLLLVGLAPMFFLGIGLFFLIAPPAVSTSPNQPPGPDPRGVFAMVGWMYTLMGAAGLAYCWVIAGCSFAAGRSLARYRRWKFCLVATGIGCFNLPIGTVLGIFTILVLQRPTVKALFEAVERGEPLPEYS